MGLKKIIISQYLASLEMMTQVVKKCPVLLWVNDESGNQFWHVAYHALFYTHLYLASSEEQYIPWGKHNDGYQFMGPVPWPPYEKPEIGSPYSQNEILEFLQFCKEEVLEKTQNLDPEAESGFSWIPVGKMELQFYNIRHLQQHIGELCERLWANDQIEIGWVGTRPAEE